ncbi:MAG: toxic anion resistance protein, partial [Caldilineaceae bacterium]
MSSAPSAQPLPEQLEPPATLHAPKPVAAIPLDKAEGMVPMEPKVVGALDIKVNDFVDQVLRADVNSEPFVNKVTAIHNLGNDEIRKAANVSNRLLDRPIQSVSSGFFDDKSPVSKALLDLRRTVEDLDPGRQNEGSFSARRLFGLVPATDKVRDYFMRYQSAQGHINAILTSLYRSQDELLKDNAAIEEEKVNLWGVMGRLQQYVYIGRKIDASLVQRIAEIEQAEPEKARVVKEEMLFYVRQKVQDLLTQQAVTIQGYLALDIVRKNNLELIKGVDRASTTTVSALRTAVIVAQALANQKLVLDQINALNATTGNVIESTSLLLKQQSTSVGQQAASSTINMEQLQRA